MEPLISIQVLDKRRVYWPGDTIRCHYQVDAVPPGELQAIEASVLWHTEGKGEEDLSVEFFERRTPAQAEERDLRKLYEFVMELPGSPHSYDGPLVKIRWCVRVRVFLKKGKAYLYELPLQVGDTPPGKAILPPESEEAAEDEGDADSGM